VKGKFMNISNMPEKRTYTVEEVATMLQISKSKAYDLCKHNLFHTINVGRTIRISKNSFDIWLDNPDICQKING